MCLYSLQYFFNPVISIQNLLLSQNIRSTKYPDKREIIPRHSRQNQCQFVNRTAYRVDRHRGEKFFVENNLPSSAGNSETDKIKQE